MSQLLWATVVSCDRFTANVQVMIARDAFGKERRALCFEVLTGTCAPGERVLLNCRATALKLGTGGYDFVVAREAGDRVEEDRSPESGSLRSSSDEGDEVPCAALQFVPHRHLMKLRYTPVQQVVSCVEEPGSETAKILRNKTSIEGVPVICCSLHSQAIGVIAALKALDRTARVAYVMTDEAALALGFSKAIDRLINAELLDVTITAGQAFGGQYEALTLHSGLLTARHIVQADYIVTSIGPGVIGAEHPYASGGIAQAEALNAAYSMGGTPIVCVRASQADERERHQGISHHTKTALRLALGEAIVPLPKTSPQVAAAFDLALEPTHHAQHIIQTEVLSYCGKAIDLLDQAGIKLTTMGRDITQDQLFFACVQAAACAAVDVRAKASDSAQ